MSKGFGQTELSVLKVLPKVLQPCVISMPGQQPLKTKAVLASDLHRAIHPGEEEEYRLSSTRRAARRLAFAGKVALYEVKVNGIIKMAIGLSPNKQR